MNHSKKLYNKARQLKRLGIILEIYRVVIRYQYPFHAIEIKDVSFHRNFYVGLDGLEDRYRSNHSLIKHRIKLSRLKKIGN